MDIWIRCDGNNPSKLLFYFVKRVVSVSGNIDLIQNCFHTLRGLQLSSNKAREIRMNERIGLGLVLSNEESAEKFCCHIFSLSVIKNLCKACFTLEVMESFLKVCSCVYKLQLDVSSESDTDSCTTTSCNSIELPSNSIWTILLLSEIFGTTRVTLDCKRKLAELLVGSLTNGSPLPPIFSDEENGKDEKLMEQQLLTHFLRFGPCIVDNNSITSKSPNFSSIHAHNLSLTNLKSREKRQFKKVIPVTEASPAESLDPSESRTSKSLKSDRNDDEQSQNSWESSHFDSVHSSLLTSELQEPKTVDNHREVEQSPQLNHPPLPETEYRPAGSAIGERLSARRNKSSKSSLEELILSRNLAMLRIKEAKIKKDLEESKIEATKMLTESRLRMLDLKTRALLSSSEKKVGKGLQRHPMGHSESPSRGIGVGTLKSPTALVNVESYIEKIDQATSTTKARLLEKKVEQKSTLTQKFDQDSRSNKKELKRNPSTPKERPPNIHSTSEISPIHLLNDSHFIESRVYSQDALKAVGLGFSPSFVTSSEQDRKVQNHKPFDGSAITKLSAQPLFVEVVLVRAWDLVECLGGTNAYVLLKVCQEQYVSHVIHNTTSPFFGTIFKLPLVPKDFSESGEKIYLRVSPIVVREKLNIVVMNKNLSLSDEVIGMTETVLEFRSTSQEYESMILNLKSEFGEYTGNVEIQVKLLSHS